MVETSATRVRQALQHAILEGVIAPGERLRAEALAQRYGTSRTPVREALLALEAEGLVALEPRRGAVVQAFDAADLIDRYEIRTLLEPAAAARAARRGGPDLAAVLHALCDAAEAQDRGGSADAVDALIALNERFHRAVLDGAASPRLAEAMRAVGGVPRAFRAQFWASAALRAESLLCHRRIAEAVAAGDPVLAEAAMRMHLQSARAALGRAEP